MHGRKVRRQPTAADAGAGVGVSHGRGAEGGVPRAVVVRHHRCVVRVVLHWWCTRRLEQLVAVRRRRRGKSGLRLVGGVAGRGLALVHGRVAQAAWHGATRRCRLQWWRGGTATPVVVGLLLAVRRCVACRGSAPVCVPMPPGRGRVPITTAAAAAVPTAAVAAAAASSPGLRGVVWGSVTVTSSSSAMASTATPHGASAAVTVATAAPIAGVGRVAVTGHRRAARAAAAAEAPARLATVTAAAAATLITRRSRGGARRPATAPTMSWCAAVGGTPRAIAGSRPGAGFGGSWHGRACEKALATAAPAYEGIC